MDLPEMASQQRGLFHVRQALDEGATSRLVRRAVDDGALERLRSGVYVDAVRPQRTEIAEHLDRVVAEQLGREPGWLAARRSAALLFDLPLIGRQPPTHPQLLRNPGGADAQARDRHARIAVVPEWQWVVYDGIEAASPARVVVDLARQESFRNAVVVADGALRRGVTPAELQAVLKGMRRWPGVVGARRAVLFADGRAESPGESLARVACAREGIRGVEPQVEIWRDHAFVARTDLMVKGALLAIESDGAAKFDAKGRLPATFEREEQIRDCGIEVLRTNWDQTFGDTSLFGHRVRNRLASAGSRRLARGVRLVATVARPQAPFLDLPWSFPQAA